MRTPIYVRRGNKVDLPALNPGEPGFAVDTKEVFLGQTSGGNLQFAMRDSKTAQVVSGGYKIQSGSGSIAVTANTQANVTITFPTAFAAAPITMVSLAGATVALGTNTGIAGVAPTATNFVIAINSGTSQTITYNWEAIGT